MKLYSKKQFYVFCLLFVIAFSCKDPKPDCGCGGPTVKVVENLRASYIGNKSLLLRQISDDNTPFEQLVVACSISDTLKITPDIKNPDYIVAGNFKEDCSKGPTFAIVSPPFEVTSIKRGL